MGTGGTGMKRAVFIIFLVLCLSFTLAAQTPNQFEAQTKHYRVISENSAEQAQLTADRLEAMLSLYNDYFHFDLGSLPARMKVRIFSSKSRFNDYLNRTIKQTRDDFVYLHYADATKSELLAFNREAPDFNVSLIHQNFIQYLRAFVPNPPLWMREGFAVYFEQSTYDPDFKTAVYKENLSWLETLKNIVTGQGGTSPIGLADMLSMDVESAKANIDVFYPEAWGMVSFLVNSENKDVNRLLWDSIDALHPQATLSENDQRVSRQAFSWMNTAFLADQFVSFVQNTKSFRGLVEAGMDSYSSGDLTQAEAYFVKALALRDDNYVPYYYMGLINYDNKNYRLADYYYRTALDKGAAPALTYYALGVNAYAADNYDEATNYLNQTISIDPDNFTDKASELLGRMNG